MAISPIQIRPTFPLDEGRLRVLKRQLIWRSPKLIVGQFVARVAEELRSAGINHPTSLVMRCLDWWSERDSELTGRVKSQMIAESNSSQDAAILAMANRLSRKHYKTYAVYLRRVLSLKIRIERSLHQHNILAGRTEELEVLVDSICQEVCNEIVSLVGLYEHLVNVLTSRNPEWLQTTSAGLVEGHKRMLHAFTSLHDTACQLREAKGLPLQRERDYEDQVLERLIANLREENKVARTIVERIRTELPDMNR